MGFDLKYGRVTLERREVPDDEPVVVFRAQDPLFEGVLRHYSGLCMKAGCDDKHMDLIGETIEQVRRWQAANPGRVKDKPGPSGRLRSELEG